MTTLIDRKIKKLLLSISEVADILGVHKETLRRWDNENKLKAIRFGKRGHRRYKKADIYLILNRDKT
ncbi:MAG: helix-turn-helix domain-containing protein [Patescibacteria group bacterium]